MQLLAAQIAGIAPFPHFETSSSQLFLSKAIFRCASAVGTSRRKDLLNAPPEELKVIHYNTFHRSLLLLKLVKINTGGVFQCLFFTNIYSVVNKFTKIDHNLSKCYS